MGHPDTPAGSYDEIKTQAANMEVPASDAPLTSAVPQGPMAPLISGGAAGGATDMAPASDIVPALGATLPDGELPDSSAATSDLLNTVGAAAVFVSGAATGDELVDSGATTGLHHVPAADGAPTAPLASASFGPAAQELSIPPVSDATPRPSFSRGVPAGGLVAVLGRPINPGTTAVLLIPNAAAGEVVNPGVATDMAPAPGVTSDPLPAPALGVPNGTAPTPAAAIVGVSQVITPPVIGPEGPAGDNQHVQATAPAPASGPHENNGAPEGRAPFPVLSLGPIHASQQTYDPLPIDFPFYQVPRPTPTRRAPFPVLSLAPVRGTPLAARLRPTDLPRLAVRASDAPYGANAGLLPGADQPAASSRRPKKRLRFSVITRTLIDGLPGFMWTKEDNGHPLATPVRPEKHRKEPTTYSMDDLHEGEDRSDEPAQNGTVEAATGGGSDAYAIELKDAPPSVTATGPRANAINDNAAEGQSAIQDASAGSDAYTVEPKTTAPTSGMSGPSGATENNTPLEGLYDSAGEGDDEPENDVGYETEEVPAAPGVWDDETLVGSERGELIEDQTNDWTHPCSCFLPMFVCAIHIIPFDTSVQAGTDSSEVTSSDVTEEDEDSTAEGSDPGASIAGQFSPFVQTFFAFRRV